MKKFKSLREAKLKGSDYDATSEKSKFDKGHRAKVVQKADKNKVLYLGAVSFKTPKAAIAAADAYLTGYALGGEKSATKMMNGYVKSNKKALVDTSVLDFMEDIGLTADDFSKDLGFHYDDSVGYKLDPMGVEIVSDPKGNDKKYSIQLKGKKANFKKAAEFLKTHVDADKVTLKGNTVIFESNMSDVKKQLGKVKGLSKDAYNQLITLPMPVLTTVVNQLSGLVASYDMNESDKAYAASLRQIAKDRTIKNLTKKDKDTLLKIADLMKNANEEADLNEQFESEFKDA